LEAKQGQRGARNRACQRTTEITQKGLCEERRSCGESGGPETSAARIRALSSLTLGICDKALAQLPQTPPALAEEREK